MEEQTTSSKGTRSIGSSSTESCSPMKSILKVTKSISKGVKLKILQNKKWFSLRQTSCLFSKWRMSVDTILNGAVVIMLSIGALRCNVDGEHAGAPFTVGLLLP